MEVQPGHAAEEIRRLQRCINDLISLLALPAIWTGSEPTQIISSLLDSLLGMLRLDFIYGQLHNPMPLEIVRVAPSQQLTARPQDFAELFRPWLLEDPQKWPMVVPNPVGDGHMPIMPSRLGLHGEIGVIVAGSRRADFPEQTERLLFGVAANQVAIALQAAWLPSEQNRIANDERKQSEEGFRAIVEKLPECVNVVARDGTLLQMNSAGLAMAGSPSADRIIGGNVYDFLPPEHRERYRKFHEKVCDGQNGSLEFDIINMQGERRHVESRSAPLRYHDGSIVQLGITRDITALKQAEQKLRESELNLNLIINTIPALAWAARTDGSAEFFNQHYLEYVGLTSEQLQDWKWTAAVHPDDLGSLTEQWQRVMASGGAGEAEARLRRFDGEYRRFLFRANPLRDQSGSVVKWFGVNTDVEDRKRAEEELRRSEAFLVEGQRLSSTGSFFWRVDNDEIRFSGELYRLFEFDQDLPLTIERIAARVHPEDIPLLQEKIESARSDRGGLDYEIRLQMPDGKVKYCSTVARSYRRQDGGLEYYGAIRDITEQYLSEQALSKLRSELAHLVRVTSLGALTASIAHEVNQPLSGIVTNANTCLRMLDADPPNIEGARETARRAIRDSNRAAQVVTRLRALFTKQAPTFELVDLNEATREVIALSLHALRINRVVLRTELNDIPCVRGDRVQLQQVILNLVQNAIDAMTTIEERPRQLLIRTERDQDGWLRLSTQDTGVGFDAIMMERLFESFYTTKCSGMGIGLSVSRSIIENHQGRLWAEPNNGPGARFSFAIPPTC